MAPSAPESSNVGDDTSKVFSNAIDKARTSIGALLDKDRSLGPLFIRLAFYDAISYDPIAKVGGPNGSIRNCEGLDEQLKRAFKVLEDLKTSTDSRNTVDPALQKYVSYGDLCQLAGIEAVKRAGGPHSIDFKHGRMDSYIPIPRNKLPEIKEDQDATSVRSIFHRAGFNDKEIVALSSAICYWMNYPPSSGSQNVAQQQQPSSGSQNVAQQPQPSIDNSYYKLLLQQESSSTSTLRYWKCLLLDKSFRKYVELFSENKDQVFEKEYAAAHKKLSELGFKQFPEPILEADYHDMRHGIAFAVAMTILVGFMGFFYESMRA